ncbi:MAG: glycosyltransferase family 2 protein, partial [Candidatus Electrothrix sp. GM3_4]|nr:glycosyltransferase family 2 protein [Candidatus Electrothrix sp. GM3_4]
MPRVSVVIPCYNQGSFIDETIHSVLAQTWQYFEIIVVNDGSTDPFTVNHLQQLNFPKTRVLHTENQGLSSARNNGIREAQGEYILPLDADDRIGPTYLEQAIRLLDADPELGIVYCKAR